jgi:hypothetical protein
MLLLRCRELCHITVSVHLKISNIFLLCTRFVTSFRSNFVQAGREESARALCRLRPISYSIQNPILFSKSFWLQKLLNPEEANESNKSGLWASKNINAAFLALICIFLLRAIIGCNNYCKSSLANNFRTHPFFSIASKQILHISGDEKNP